MARFKASHGWPRLAEANQLGLGSAGPGQGPEPRPCENENTSRFVQFLTTKDTLLDLCEEFTRRGRAKTTRKNLTTMSTLLDLCGFHAQGLGSSQTILEAGCSQRIHPWQRDYA